MKIYLAGPMTGIEKYNRPQFNLMQKRLEWKNHIVLNPARHPDGLTYDEYMELSRCDIRICDAVCFLDGWEESKGAREERKYAEDLGKFCFFNLFIPEDV